MLGARSIVPIMSAARFAFVLVGLMMAVVVRGQSTWTGAVDTNWATAGNWSPSGVPGVTTDVTIPAGAGAVNVAGASIRSLTTARAITVTGQMQISTGVTLQSGAVVTFNGGYFYINPAAAGTNVSISGSGELVAGLSNSGSIYVVNGTQLSIGSGRDGAAGLEPGGGLTILLLYLSGPGAGEYPRDDHQ